MSRNHIWKSGFRWRWVASVELAKVAGVAWPHRVEQQGSAWTLRGARKAQRAAIASIVELGEDMSVPPAGLL